MCEELVKWQVFHWLRSADSIATTINYKPNYQGSSYWVSHYRTTDLTMRPLTSTQLRMAESKMKTTFPRRRSWKIRARSGQVTIVVRADAIVTDCSDQLQLSVCPLTSAHSVVCGGNAEVINLEQQRLGCNNVHSKWIVQVFLSGQVIISIPPMLLC